SLTVAVFVNSGKHPLFDAAQRIALVREATAHIANVHVDISTDLLASYVQAHAIQVIIRGLRAVLDFDYEFQIALMNKRMAPNADTVFMLTNERHSYLSSTIIKELASYGADVSSFVPAEVATALSRKYLKK
ncbi:MAG: pantetheine-phosphate adenylyltransferase, partial [Firmicutes bacterium]|nr:pantetheine-phosphate adenylyltransferase [Bacillota bacterium]